MKSINLRKKCRLLVLTSLLPLIGVLDAEAQNTGTLPVLTIRADQVVAPLNSTFSGMMTEEINHSYDGGLYAELIQNRVFKDNSESAVHWSVVQETGAAADISLDTTNSLNEQLPVSLRLEVRKMPSKSRAGIANEGYWGIPLKPGTHYRASFYSKTGAGYTGGVKLSLESPDGKISYASGTTGPLSSDWRKYTVDLKTSHTVKPTTDARFVISAQSTGTVWFNLVSLFPPTWNNRANGNRVDLMQFLADMKPGFLRFPGGNYLEGSSIASRFPWKETLGDVSKRPGHPGCWGYRSQDGLGLLEFLEWAEDLHAQPLLAVYAGYSLPSKNELVRPGPDLAPYVADALDEIEYVMGGTNTTWGARRAADGHPAPFELKYVEIGNEDWFDPSGSYDARFSQFYDAIKARYPQLLLISTVGNEQPENKRVHSRIPDLVDEHYYWRAGRFEKEAPIRFDKYPRNGPKIFVGEWAAYENIEPWNARSQNLPPTPSFKAALGDAAWLTAMERNADIIPMQCYAPMLVNVNKGARQWRPNLIGYDALRTFGSPSYYTIKLFNENSGDVVVKSMLENNENTQSTPINYSASKDSKRGIIYLKLVNASPEPRPLRIHFEGVRKILSKGAGFILQSNELEAGNSLDNPLQIVPKVKKLTGLKLDSVVTLEPGSITILKIRAE